MELKPAGPPMARPLGDSRRKLTSEQEAAQRATDSIAQARQIEESSRQEMDHLRDTYEKQYVAQQVKQDATLEEQQFEGHEKLRKLKQSQESDLHRTQRQGEHELQKLKDYYSKKIYQNEQNGQSTLAQAQKKTEKQVLLEKERGESVLADLEQRYTFLTQKLIEQEGSDLHQLIEAQKRELDGTRSRYEEANESSRDLFDTRFAKTMKEQSSLIQKVKAEADQRVEKLKLQETQSLNSVQSKIDDPFYQMMDLNAVFEEADDAYIVRVRVPEYEQSKVSALIRGNALVISGHRRNELKAKSEEGHQKSTASYQTFQESFPLEWPIEPKSLLRETQGDELSFRISKKKFTLRPE